MKQISIIIPVYFNENNLQDTIPQLLLLKDKFSTYLFELIFVDDGSKDNSLNVLKNYQKIFPSNIVIVKLSRNFGSMSAISAGISVATGNCVGIISADLQDPPELFEKMIHYWEKGNKLILATRIHRDEPLIQNIFSRTFYKFVRNYAIQNYPNGGFDFLLADEQVVNEIRKIQEKNSNIMALFFWLGFDPIIIPYNRRRREKGKSRWTVKKKIKLFIDTFVAFSYIPIRLLSFIGIIVAICSFLYGLFIFFYWLIYGYEVMGWVPTMIVLTFTSGIQMTMLGILGEYLWRTLDETRNRPPYVIDEIYRTPL